MNIEELTAAPMVRAADDIPLTICGDHHIADRADVLRAMLAAKFDARVSVTRDDIDDGIGGNCQRCPVALALQRRLFPVVRRVDVEADNVTLTTAVDGYFWLRVGACLPHDVSRFVGAYDRAKLPKARQEGFVEDSPMPGPFDFQLTVTTENLREAYLV